ncbi:PAS domain-containing sensor histidine kinase [Hymenobacter actinosclerus]|uniref:histidine kinase n=1 Tax=Hymenobacter actinosclerus TaxID=82805 RepID=A0A1I0DW36_9BACT|nr:PAS domain-containing protein [Hymenobacter actinosclerus]SET36248.1 PAS domain S-box-containing protein [Hymenobacter actinosclerus]
MPATPSGLPLSPNAPDTDTLQAKLLAATRQLLQEREAFYQVFEQTPALVTILRGPDHRFAYFNPAQERMFPGRQLLGQPLATVLPDAATQGFVALLDRVYATGEPHVGVEVPAYLNQPNGQPPRLHYFTFAYQRFEEDGRPAGISVFGTDVTEQVRARQERDVLQAQVLAAAQRRAQEHETSYQLFEQSPALIALLREPGHRIEYYNAAYRQLFPGRELRGRPLAEAVPEVVAQGLLALLDAVYQTGDTHFGSEVPLVVAAADGGPAHALYLNFTCQAYREAGRIVGVSLFAYDVTEQVLARHEHEALQQRQQALFEQAPVAIGVFAGPAYVVEICNPGLQAIWGRTAAQALHRPLLEVLPEVRDQGFKQLLDEVRATGRPYVAQERRAELLHQGQLITVYLNFVYQPLRDENGLVTAVAAVATDVTEQVTARQQVQALNDELTITNRQLTRTNTDLDTFVYTASHDLKTPVSNIEGLLLALLEELPPEVRQAGVVQLLLDRMQGAVERFQLTIAQLTDVARLQKAQAQPAEVVDLAVLVEDLRLDLAPLLATSGARLTLDVAACPQVSFAPQHLRSIVYNLLSNAVKYRHPDRPPHVQLRCRSTEALVVLEVEDNGLGLSPDQQGELFGLFRRLHDHVEGSGLGLYMVKRLVENAGGTIRVQSEAGLGSTFTVTLPRTASNCPVG